MAEIAGDESSPPLPTSEGGETSGAPSTSSPSDTSGGGGGEPSPRTSKPGRKRLVLTASVLLSFLIGLPLLLSSTEIHRSPLPSDAIAALSRRLQSNPPSFPYGLHAVFLRSGGAPSEASVANRIGRDISAQLVDLPNVSNAGNTLISVTVESAGGCSSSSNVASHWRCRAVITADLVRGDEVFDELLHSALGGGGGDGMRVYTVVFVESDDVEELRIVIGKHRHAWVVGKVNEAEVASIVGKVFVKYFMNGGAEEGEPGIVKREFMPVGSDGNIVLSFSLLNANPSDWVYDWEFGKIGERMLTPVIEALRPIANINIESQVLYHTPKSSYSYSDEKLGGNVLSMGDIPFFMWGGVVIWNPPGCSLGSKPHGTLDKMPSQELMETIEIFIGQLRQLFGLKSSYHAQSTDSVTKFITSPKGFAQWELDLLYRHHARSNLLSCITTLESLSSLVQSLPRMIVMDEIGRQVELSLEAAGLAQRNASLGIISATRARALAEDAFFHPSIMSISYASIEHYFAIYMPFFAPVSLHVLLAVMKELKRYRTYCACELANQAKI
uniref:GPI transamidase component PIG-S n=1 Tax=Leersia perrieri TaxID=77586 RepID=A0A0D9V999_9ORYZ